MGGLEAVAGLFEPHILFAHPHRIDRRRRQPHRLAAEGVAQVILERAGLELDGGAVVARDGPERGNQLAAVLEEVAAGVGAGVQVAEVARVGQDRGQASHRAERELGLALGVQEAAAVEELLGVGGVIITSTASTA